MNYGDMTFNTLQATLKWKVIANIIEYGNYLVLGGNLYVYQTIENIFKTKQLSK